MWRTTLALILSSLAAVSHSAASGNSAANRNSPASGNNAVNEQCSPDRLQATYSIATSKPDKLAKKPEFNPKPQLLRLWRNNKQVAIEYPQTHITELWEQTRNKGLHLVRNFDESKRGIEYQPQEIKDSHDWSLKYQLISESLRQRMQLEKTVGEGCDQQEFYTLEENSVRYHLIWLPRLRLASSFQVLNPRVNISWALESLDTSDTAVTRRFSLLESYDTTDYTDIGDNESDPFLRKMIHLGFVEHGGSGFYDSEGNPLDAHHHH